MKAWDRLMLMLGLRGKGVEVSKFELDLMNRIEVLAILIMANHQAPKAWTK
jgi:hypothetical protein